MNYPEWNSSSQPMNSSQEIGMNKEVNDFIDEIMIWRDESHKQFLDLANTHCNIINKSMNNLVKKIANLQTQLYKTTRERNDLIEKVRCMSNNIQSQPNNEGLRDLFLKVVESSENKEMCFEAPLSSGEEHGQEQEFESDEEFSDHEQIMNSAGTESSSTSGDFEAVEELDKDVNMLSQNYIQQEGHMENNGSTDRISINDLQVQEENNSDDPGEHSETRLENRKAKTKVDLPTPLSKQKKSLGEKKLKCEQCSYTAHWPYALKEHVEKHHIKIKRYACDECTYRATSKGRLNEHKRSCKFTSSRKFKCDHCPSMGFVRKDSFMRHMNKWH